MLEQLNIGTIIFKQNIDKVRPYICIHVYKNKAGIPYNWLIIPVTTSNKVGVDNLVKIKHDILKDSYVKINNMTTIQIEDIKHIKISKHHLDNNNIRLIIYKIIKNFKSQ
jgi:hypothetical protein